MEQEEEWRHEPEKARDRTWCQQEQVFVWQQFELLEAGKAGTHEWDGSTSVDTSLGFKVEEAAHGRVAITGTIKRIEELIAAAKAQP